MPGRQSVYRTDVGYSDDAETLRKYRGIAEHLSLSEIEQIGKAGRGPDVRVWGAGYMVQHCRLLKRGRLKFAREAIKRGDSL